MTKKDYILIASELHDLAHLHLDLTNPVVAQTWDHFLEALCSAFRQDNPRFDADQFHAAVQKGQR